jgi:hypothetical protein
MNEYRNYDDENLYSNEYGVHVNAMTAEKLHGKSEIAQELACRDITIKAQAEEIERLKSPWLNIDNPPELGGWYLTKQTTKLIGADPVYSVALFTLSKLYGVHGGFYKSTFEILEWMHIPKGDTE